MIRITNRSDQELITSVPQVHYVERQVDKHIIERVEVPVEKIVEVPVVQKEVEQVDLQPIHDRQENLEIKLIDLDVKQSKRHHETQDQIEAQSTVLVALRQQEHLSRKRRLQFIRKMLKQRDQHNKSIVKLKIAVAVSLLLSVISLIVH